MESLLVVLMVLAAAGVAALLLSSNQKLSLIVGLAGCAIAGVVMVGASLQALHQFLGGAVPLRYRLPWNVPYGSFFLELDALSAFFVLVIGVVTATTSVFSYQYLLGLAKGRSLGSFAFFLNFFVAGMLLVVLARNGVLFLLSWEIMSLAAYFLVTFADDTPEVRDAGWSYLVAAHLGAAFLFALFVMFGQGSPALDFPDHPLAGQAAATASAIFILALVGFGTKAGFVPLHVWLPDTYAAAPSPVSAIMSGAMSKMGIYGILRVIALLPSPPLWWGITLILIGSTTGLFGIVMANAQRRFRRLIAYSSIENLGIVALGLGAGLVGLSVNKHSLAFLGFAGAILHVLNHAIMKSLLFLSGGAVEYAARTDSIERLGGLMKRMPAVGASFLVGVVAISALPPLNGFIGEFLIYLGAFSEALTLQTRAAFPALIVIASLALIGGLTVAGFSKLFGLAFLGTSRSEDAEQLRPAGRLMVLPLVVLAGACVLVAILAPLFVPLLAPVIGVPARVSSNSVADVLTENASSWEMVIVMSGVFIAILLALILFRHFLLRNREVGSQGTWGCGYTAPSSRMQYTASSFSQPIVDMVGALIGNQKQTPHIEGYFPQNVPEMKSETPDLTKKRFYVPLYGSIQALLARLRWLHHGRVHYYVLYVAITLLVLLVWYLGGKST